MIWVFGDSFSADSRGWPGMLNSKTTGFRGSSEFRIYRNYLTHKHLISESDTVIFCHTHMSRVYLKDENRSLSSRLLESHPFCDLLFNDVIGKQEKNFIRILDEIWDDSFFEYVYFKLISDSKAVKNSIHITFFNDMATQFNLIDFSSYFKTNRGKINHLDDAGNLEVYKNLVTLINN